MKKTLLTIALSSTVSVAHASMYEDALAASVTQDRVQQTQNQQPQSNQQFVQSSSFRDRMSSMIGSGIQNATASQDAKQGAADSNMTVEQYKQQQNLKKLKEERDIARKQYELAKQLTGFVKTEKKIILGKNKYIDIFIPFNQRSVLEFDSAVKDFRMFPRDGLIIQKVQGSDRKIEIINPYPDLESPVEVTFIDDRQYMFTLQTGKATTERHVRYKIFTDNTSIAAKTLFMKPTRWKNKHEEFNMNAFNLIISFLEQNDDFYALKENMRERSDLENPDDFVIHNGEGMIESLYGVQYIDYKMVINRLFESPYFAEKNSRMANKSQLILLDINVTNNHKSEALSLNEQLISNRFSNFVAFWVGDLDSRDNILSPGQSKNILVVIEDVVK